jgi:hypothetical protein
MRQATQGVAAEKYTVYTVSHPSHGWLVMAERLRYCHGATSATLDNRCGG